MSDKSPIPPFPHDEGLISKFDWYFNYGTVVVLHALVFIMLYVFFTVLAWIKRVLRA